MDRTSIDYNPYKDYDRENREKSRKKKVVKWYDRLTTKKEKKHNKTRDIEREDEI